MKFKKSPVLSCLVLSCLVLLIGSSLLFTSCENFFNGNLIKEELDSLIDYANAPYADITISSTNAATESIVPAAGNYSGRYKVTDKINLSFVPSQNYCFVKWTAQPEGSISFDNEKSLSVTATVQNIDQPVYIEPLVLERAGVSVTPGNLIENPRNSTVVISFTKPMNLTQELLDKIEITENGVSVKENYKNPVLNEDKTKITFVPDRDNYIKVDSGYKVITVSVPSSFSYSSNGIEVTLAEKFQYSFKINSTTETSAEISVRCSESEGTISYTGTKTYYLDDEIKVKVTPKESYSYSGWKATYNDDGSEVEDNILQLDLLQEDNSVSVKLLTGTSRSITVSPVLVEKGSVLVNFESDHGVTIPLEQKKYYVGDTFHISYREDSGYIFTGWKALDSKGIDVSEATIETDNDGNIVKTIQPLVKIENKNSLETDCTVLSGGSNFTLIAGNSSRPKISAFSPAYSSDGVPRNSKIKVIFSQKMSNASIYWTKQELQEKILKDTPGVNVSFSANAGQSYDSLGEYRIFKYENKFNPAGEQYYYAYQKGTSTATLQYKNIIIRERETGNNLLSHFKAPKYETSSNTVLTIASNNSDPVGQGQDIEVIISSDFANAALIPLGSEYVGAYLTNAKTVTSTPNINLTSLSINGNTVTTKQTLGAVTSDDYSTVQDIKVQIQANVKDATGIKLLLEPVDSSYAQVKEVYSIVKGVTNTESLTATGALDFNFTADDIYEGYYKINVLALDDYEHEQTADSYAGIRFDPKSTYTRSSKAVITFPTGTISDNKGTYSYSCETVEDLKKIQITMTNPNYQYRLYSQMTGNNYSIDDGWKQSGTSVMFNGNETGVNSLCSYIKNTGPYKFAVQVRDVFNTDLIQYCYFVVKFEDKPYIDPDYFSKQTITGRGTTVTFKAKDICSGIQRIYINAYINGSTTAATITGVEVIRKVGTVTNSNGTHYVEHAVIKDPGENDITVMVRGLTLADNLTLQIKAVDLNGNESDWVNVNTQSN